MEGKRTIMFKHYTNDEFPAQSLYTIDSKCVSWQESGCWID